MLDKPSADEIDPWLRYTGWNRVLGQSKHDIVKTLEYASMPDPEESELVRLIDA